MNDLPASIAALPAPVPGRDLVIHDLLPFLERMKYYNLRIVAERGDIFIVAPREEEA